jgi:uncharacterized iron-regulated membrane protein
MRGLIVQIHRWAGLSIALFVTVAGLTGAMLAHWDAIEAWSAPAFAASRPAPDTAMQPLSPLVLRERAALLTGGDIGAVRFDNPAGVPAVFYVEGVTGYDEIALDPWTGAELGRRSWGDISEGWVNLVPFLYRLHVSLGFEGWGTWLFGLAALIWTFDCFFGAYLTFPAHREGRSTWRSRWAKAWKVRIPFRSAARRDMDLHRAGGLWFWLILLLFAWSSVGYNFSQVYNPVMEALTGIADPRDNQAPVSEGRPPRLSWHQALAQAKRHMATLERERGVKVAEREVLIWDSAHGLWRMRIRLQGEPSNPGHSDFAFYDATGAIAWTRLARGDAARWAAESWWFGLHVAGIGGQPGRWVVTIVGLVCAVLSITGMTIWWRKRLARRHRSIGIVPDAGQCNSEAGLKSFSA